MPLEIELYASPPGCFAFPEFPMGYYREIMPTSLICIRMTNADLDALVITYTVDNEIDHWIDPRNGKHFFPFHLNERRMTFEDLKEKIHEDKIAGIEYRFLVCEVNTAGCNAYHITIY